MLTIDGCGCGKCCSVVEVVVAVVAVDSVVVVVVQVELSVTSGEILKSFEPTLNKPPSTNHVICG